MERTPGGRRVDRTGAQGPSPGRNCGRGQGSLPDILRTVQNDFGPAAIGARITAWLDGTAKREEFVNEARARIAEECDYLNEADRQKEFALRFADHPTIWIPAVYPDYSADGVLTTQFVDGVHLDDYLASAPCQADLDRAGSALFDFYYGSLFHHGLYNCDPHPGNYLFCPDGRVAVLDHGCTRMFAASFVAQVAALTRAVEADDRDSIRTAMVDIGILHDKQFYDHRVARQLLRWFYGPLLQNHDSAFEAPDVSVRRLVSQKDLRSFAIPAEFLFLVRMRIGVASVLARLGAKANWQQRQRTYLDEAEYQLATSDPFYERAPAYDVVLIAPGERVIELVRELRDALDISVRDAKVLADDAPSVLGTRMSRTVSDDLAARLRTVGSTIELRRV